MTLSTYTSSPPRRIPRPRARAFAPGKVILFGEHAVVDGAPAVAVSLRQGVTATSTPSGRCRLAVPAGTPPDDAERLRRAFDLAAELAGRPPVAVSLTSDLPSGVGLGSSAALSVACARILARAAGRGAVDPLALAHAMEDHFHGMSSGLDASCADRGGIVVFRRQERRGEPEVESLRPCVRLPLVIVIHGRRPPSRATVEAVQDRARRPVLLRIARIAKDGVAALRAGDLRAVGALMTRNHSALVELGVTDDTNQRIVHRMLDLGAYGAKVTGAGGGGGAVIALAREPHAIAERLAAEGFHVHTSEVRA